jgi:hypothetical protein
VSGWGLPEGSPDLQHAPFYLDDRYWTGQRRSLDGTEVRDIEGEDVAEVLYGGSHPNEGWEGWSGIEAAILRLHDGTLVAYETWWDATFTGFDDQGYGEASDVWFSKPENLNILVLQALTDEGRRLCGIPVEGL